MSTTCHIWSPSVVISTVKGGTGGQDPEVSGSSEL